MKRVLPVLFIIITTISLPVFAETIEGLRPFTSDGCSAFPDGTLAKRTLWLNCCTEHDRAYWLGGSYQKRVEADEALKQCVAEIGEPEIAAIMLAGVRVGGSPFWISSFRWGYGWPYFEGWRPRGYKAVTAQQKKLAEALIQTD